MTIGITGPERRAPGRNAVVGIIIAAIVVGIFLILLGLTGDVLVDWLWFSSIGYLQVFLTSIGAKAVLFFAVLTATGAILWLNGLLAVRFPGGSGPSIPPRGNAPALRRCPIRSGLCAIGCRGPELSQVVQASSLYWLPREKSETGISFCGSSIRCPMAQTIQSTSKDIGFYLFSLPAYIVIKNWMLLALSLSAFFAAAIYWVHGDIACNAQQRSMSLTAIAHGSVLLGFFFAVKAWSYGLDRYRLLYGDNGVVVGASYTDIHVELPVLWLLIGLSAARRSPHGQTSGFAPNGFLQPRRCSSSAVVCTENPYPGLLSEESAKLAR
jgi:hypothetical protein